MLNCSYLYDYFVKRGVDFFTGVPDSLLKDFCAYVVDHAPQDKHIIAANEGGAVALACGHHLATRRIGLVYMQNSGEGNAMNPLVSLADSDVYNIPLILLIGWRGEPGERDEPQHVKQGKITLSFLDTLNIPYKVLPKTEKEAKDCLEDIFKVLKERNAPIALIVEKDTFRPYEPRNISEPNVPRESKKDGFELTREDAIKQVVSGLTPSDIVVSTTGKTSRELYELREKLGQGHSKDFLTVGSMGHSSQIALGIALSKPSRQVFCLDGDGALLMHMGSLGIIGSRKVHNFKHIIINNASHDSVGGQPTVGFSISFTGIAKACGYTLCLTAQTASEIVDKIKVLRAERGPALLEIKVRRGARPDLGRPKTSPKENKAKFMEFLSKRSQSVRMGQKEYFGAGAINFCKDILEKLSAKRILLVRGKKSYIQSGAKDYLDKILANYKVFIFNDFENNPKFEDVIKGVELARHNKYDVVIAVGGGSVIDMAKMVNFFAQNEIEPLEYIEKGTGAVKEGNAAFRKGKPLIAIPTTAGSGSEATHFGVLYVGGKKCSVSHEYILPDFTIIDPKLTMSLPAKITAVSGMDALSQAIESYWSVNSTDESKEYARRSIELILPNLTTAVKNPNEDSRLAMAEAAHLAGKAINMTKTTASHAISYPLTSYFNIPHGHAVAATLPTIAEYNYNVLDSDIADKRGCDYVRKTIEEIAGLLGTESVANAKVKIGDLMKEIGLEAKLSQLGFKSPKDIDKVIEEVDPERSKNNPRTLTREAIRKILDSIY